MQVLIMTQSAGNPNSDRLALVERSMLTGIDLDRINGKAVNSDESTEEERDIIVSLFQRLGLEPGGTADLAGCLDPEPPFVVDDVVRIYWSV